MQIQFVMVNEGPIHAFWSIKDLQMPFKSTFSSYLSILFIFKCVYVFFNNFDAWGWLLTNLFFRLHRAKKHHWKTHSKKGLTKKLQILLLFAICMLTFWRGLPKSSNSNVLLCQTYSVVEIQIFLLIAKFFSDFLPRQDGHMNSNKHPFIAF